MAGRSVGFAAWSAAFEVAEPFFVVSDSVGECFEPGAEVGDRGGESGEGVWVVAVMAVWAQSTAGDAASARKLGQCSQMLA